MAFELHHTPFPGIAAGTIAAGAAVNLGTTDRAVTTVASATDEVFGVTHVGVATGEAVAIHGPGEVVKAIAAASIAGGAEVSYSPASGGYFPGIAASGHSAAGANVSGAVVPGDEFALYIRPGGIA